MLQNSSRTEVKAYATNILQFVICNFTLVILAVLFSIGQQLGLTIAATRGLYFKDNFADAVII